MYDGPGRYRHFKGDEYEVLGVGLTEDAGEPAVIYRPLFAQGQRLLMLAGADFWTRPLEDFDATVLRTADRPAGPGAQDVARTAFMPRFEKLL